MIKPRTCYLKYTHPFPMFWKAHGTYFIYTRPSFSGLFHMDNQGLVMRFYISSTFPSWGLAEEGYGFAALGRIRLIERSIPVHINILSWKKPFCYFFPLPKKYFHELSPITEPFSAFSNSAPNCQEIASWHVGFHDYLKTVREDAEPRHFQADRKFLVSCKLFILSPCHFRMWEKLTIAFNMSRYTHHTISLRESNFESCWFPTYFVLVQPVISF